MVCSNINGEEFNLGGFQDTGRGKADLFLLLTMLSRLPLDVIELMIAIVNDISAVTEKDFTRIPVDMLSILNLDAVESNTISAGKKEHVCQKLTGNAGNSKTADRLLQTFDCETLIRNGATFKCTGSLAEAINKQILRASGGGALPAADQRLLLKCSDGMSKGLVNKLTKDILLEAGNIEELRNSPRDVTNACIRKLGDFNSLTDDQLKRVLKNIKNIPAAKIHQLSSDQVRAASMELLDIPNLKTATKRGLCKKFKQAVDANGNGWNAADFKTGMRFCGNDRQMISKMNVASLIASLDTNPDTNFADVEYPLVVARSLCRRLKQDTGFANVTGLDGPAIAKIRNLLGGCGTDFVRRLDPAAVGDAIANEPKFRAIKGLSKEVARIILLKYVRAVANGSFGSLNSEHINNTGILMIHGIRPNDIKELNATIFKEGITDNLEFLDSFFDDFARGVTDAIVRRGLRDGVITNVDSIGRFAEKIPPKQYRDLGASALGNFTIDANLKNHIKVAKSQCQLVYKAVRTQFGPPSEENDKFTVANLENVGQAVCGMPVPDIDNLPCNREFFGIIKHFAEAEIGKRLDGRQIRAIVRKIKSCMQAEPESEEIRAAAPFLKNPDITIADLKSYGTKWCSEILTGLRETSLNDATRDRTAALANEYAVTFCGLLGDTESLGQLACGLTKANMEAMPTDGVRDTLETYSTVCDISLAGRKDVLANAIDKLGLTDLSAATADQIGVLRMLKVHLSASDRAALNVNAVVDTAADVRDAKQLRDRNRQDPEFGQFTADRQKILDESNTFIKEVIVPAMKSRNVQAVPRRKRQAGSLTCEDILTLGGEIAGTIDAVDIQTMGNTEFAECENTFAQADLTAAQAAAAATLFKAVHGASGTWDSETIQSLGAIGKGLTVGELGAITFNNVDDVAYLGNVAGWTAEQKSAIFSRYLDNVNSGSSSTLAADDIDALGGLLCGATSAHVDAIPFAAYSDAATSVGTLQCDAAIMQSFAAKAKMAFGAVNSWDSIYISAVGNVIGHLPAADLSALTSEQIGYIPDSAISSIPLQNLAVVQINSLSEAQLAGISQAQIDALSAEQLTAVNTIAGLSLNPTVVVAPGSTVAPGTTGPGGSGGAAVGLKASSSMAFILSAMILFH